MKNETAAGQRKVLLAVEITIIIKPHYNDA